MTSVTVLIRRLVCAGLAGGLLLAAAPASAISIQSLAAPGVSVSTEGYTYSNFQVDLVYTPFPPPVDIQFADGGFTVSGLGVLGRYHVMGVNLDLRFTVTTDGPGITGTEITSSVYASNHGVEAFATVNGAGVSARPGETLSESVLLRSHMAPTHTLDADIRAWVHAAGGPSGGYNNSYATASIGPITFRLDVPEPAVFSWWLLVAIPMLWIRPGR
jgi:hypothetical protein